MRSPIGPMLLLAAFCPFAAQSAGGGRSGDSMPPLSYVHLYADAKGISHFRQESLDFHASRSGGPFMHALDGGPGAMLLRLKPGAFEDWHNAPKPWYLIVVQGVSEVKASDGEVRRFGPGAIILVDDATGKGHQTRALGDIDHIAAVIPVAEPAAGTVRP